MLKPTMVMTGAALLLAGVAFAQEDYSTWSHGKHVNVDARIGGGGAALPGGIDPDLTPPGSI